MWFTGLIEMVRVGGWETGYEVIDLGLEKLKTMWEFWGRASTAWHYEEKGEKKFG